MWKWSELKKLFTKNSDWDILDLGAIMWPVIYPAYKEEKYNPSEPHITVVVFNGINNPGLGFTKEDVFEVVKSVPGSRSQLSVVVDDLEYFGKDNDIPVLRVSHSFLENYRADITGALDSRGIEYDTRFPEYKPHVTITQEAASDKAYPHELWTRPAEVWWGDTHFKYNHTLDAWFI